MAYMVGYMVKLVWLHLVTETNQHSDPLQKQTQTLHTFSAQPMSTRALFSRMTIIRVSVSALVSVATCLPPW